MPGTGGGGCHVAHASVARASVPRASVVRAGVVRAGVARASVALACAAFGCAALAWTGGALAGCSGEDNGASADTSDAGPFDGAGYRLPPVSEAGLGDTVVGRAYAADIKPFLCGSVHGALEGDLYCNRISGHFGWGFTPANPLCKVGPLSSLWIMAFLGDPADPATVALTLDVSTGTSLSPTKLTCATVPKLPTSPCIFGPAFLSQLLTWKAACDSATEVLDGSSFELDLTSVGALARAGDTPAELLGAVLLDAGADAFDWKHAKIAVDSDTFHGTFKATLVAPDAGPISVDMRF